MSRGIQLSRLKTDLQEGRSRYFRATVPAVLSFLLLLVQILIPWTVPELVTEDGPSHLYTAVVAQGLLGNALLGTSTPYSSVYRFNTHVLPNWGSTIVLGILSLLGGPRHAEQLFMSFAICAGFFSLSYAVHSVRPAIAPWSPLLNVLLQSWFLWLGFYNFYLGMVLVPFVVGYFLRHMAALTAARTAVLAALMAALFFTHLLAAFVGLLVIGTVAVWMFVLVPHLSGKQPEWSIYAPWVKLSLALAPTVALIAIFVVSSAEPPQLDSQLQRAFDEFPMHIFSTSIGRSGAQSFLWPVVLCLIVLPVLGMRRKAWRSPLGGLALAVGALFLTYLFIPDAGLGGGESKIRFSWALFLIGGSFLAGAAMPRMVRLPLAVYFFVFLLGTLVSTARTLTACSRAIEDYLAIGNRIQPGSRIVRLRYPTPSLPKEYGFEGIGRDPLFHLDALIASQCRCIDLSDYQAPSGIFPIVFAPSIDRGLQSSLWGLEGPGSHTSSSLEWIRNNVPVPIDYVIVVSNDQDELTKNPDYARLLESLGKNMRLVATSHPNEFAKLYERIGLR